MNAADVVGYAYDADTHCVECTEKKFGTEFGTELDNDDVIDDEGNTISPIFAGEDAYETCGVCQGNGQHQCEDGCRNVHACGRCDGTGGVSRVCGDCNEALIAD